MAEAIAAIVAALGAMSFAPTAYSTGSSLLNTIGNIAIGGKPSGAPGGTFGGITVRNLMGALTPTSLIQRAVGGASFVKSNAGMFAENAKYGVQMAGAGAQQPTTRLGKIGQTLDGAGVGIWATLKNFKGLRSGTKKGNTGFVNDVLEASTNGGLLGVLKNSGSGRYVSNVGQSLGGLKNALVGFGSGNPVGRFIAKTGGVAGQILSGIAGPNGLDLGGMAGGVKNFLGAGKTVIGNGLSNAWQTVSQSKVGSTVLGVGSKVAGAASKIGGGALSTVKGALNVGGAGLNVLGTTVGPVAAKLGSGFMALLGTFGPVITGIGTIVAAVSLLGDHFEDIRNIVGMVFGEGGLAVFDKFTGKIAGSSPPRRACRASRKSYPASVSEG